MKLTCQENSCLTSYLGRPVTAGNTARGASSPAKPALHMPDPLSITTQAMSSSTRLIGMVIVWFGYRNLFLKGNETLRETWRKFEARKYKGGGCLHPNLSPTLTHS